MRHNQFILFAAIVATKKDCFVTTKAVIDSIFLTLNLNRAPRANSMCHENSE